MIPGAGAAFRETAEAAAAASPGAAAGAAAWNPVASMFFFRACVWRWDAQLAAGRKGGRGGAEGGWVESEQYEHSTGSAQTHTH